MPSEPSTPEVCDRPVFCWAHVRRKFHDLHLAGSPLAKEALDRIGRLFDIERAISGGERAAAIYTLIETAKLNGLDPEAYLREVFSRIADHPINRIADLLPWNLSPRSATLAA